MKGTESFKQTIYSYLEQRANEDTLFAEKYHAVNRSIDDIVTYIPKIWGFWNIWAEKIWGFWKIARKDV